MGLNHQRELRARGQTEAQAIYPCGPSSPDYCTWGREGWEEEGETGALSAAVKNLHESVEHQGILPLPPPLFI